MYILGISCLYHDAAACLVKDGMVVAAAEEERFTRRKHDSRIPLNAIAYCLEAAAIGPDDLDHVVFYEKPLLKFERILVSAIDGFPASRDMFVRAMTTWLREKLWIQADLRSRLSRRTILFGEHHISHAASAFFASPFSEAAVLTADAVGEWATTTIGIGQDRSLKLIKEIRFPHSLGFFYSAFTRYLGFEVNEGEYKVMGMAGYGRPLYVDRVRRVIDVADDGSFQLDLDYFEHGRRLRLFGQRLVDLFGPPRLENAPMEQRHADIAASVQAVTEDVLVRIATALRRETGMGYLCMAGGVALNGLANSRILRDAGFTDLFVQPAAGDAGGSLGAALFLSHGVLGLPRVWKMDHAYLGPSIDDAEVAVALQERGIGSSPLQVDDLIRSTADLLAEGKVVAWCRGRMEFGPRALGARSILADPTRPEMKDVLNERIKHREAFRPFAPSVTAEDAPTFFDLRTESPFMLQIPSVRPEQRSRIPAVTHVDGTARVQTIDRRANPAYYDLLREFERRRGVPVLLNTSLNLRGEPIVCSVRDALAFYERTEIDALVLGDHLLRYPRSPRTRAHVPFRELAAEEVIV